jgi:glycosyltransferase involved in cell wall biosynthesis
VNLLKADVNRVAPLQTVPGRVAIVHDWLVVYGGAERVLRELIEIYPDCDLYSIIDFLPDSERNHLHGKRARTTFIQKLPFAKKSYRFYLALMPFAIEQFDLSEYDLVISNSYAVAKGVITGPDQTHICFCQSPIRYAWDLQHQYLRQAGLSHGVKSILARLVLHYIRIWDTRTSCGVDKFIGNSNYIARRINRIYRRDASVVNPPVDINAFPLRINKEDFYLTASRMVPYKRIDLIVEAFASLPQRRLIVIGDGPEMERIRKLAGPNVTLLGYQENEVLRDYMQRARAFIFAAEEDFGIIPIEAQACGTPVIAFGKGGALETVVGLDDADKLPTGVFFESQTVAALVRAIERFESATISPEICRFWAERFSIDNFRASWRSAVAM